MKRLLIVGAGGHGHSLAEAVHAVASLQLPGFWMTPIRNWIEFGIFQSWAGW